MTISLREFEQQRRQAELAIREADRAEGFLEQALQRLKQEHGVTTVAAARKKLKEQAKQRKELLRKHAAALKEFRQCYNERGAARDS